MSGFAVPRAWVCDCSHEKLSHEKQAGSCQKCPCKSFVVEHSAPEHVCVKRAYKAQMSQERRLRR